MKYLPFDSNTEIMAFLYKAKWRNPHYQFLVYFCLFKRLKIREKKEKEKKETIKVFPFVLISKLLRNLKFLEV